MGPHTRVAVRHLSLRERGAWWLPTSKRVGWGIVNLYACTASNLHDLLRWGSGVIVSAETQCLQLFVPLLRGRCMHEASFISHNLPNKNDACAKYRIKLGIYFNIYTSVPKRFRHASHEPLQNVCETTVTVVRRARMDIH